MEWDTGITVAPYHPSSNGLTECVMQTCKAALKKMLTDSKLASYVANYAYFSIFAQLSNYTHKEQLA